MIIQDIGVEFMAFMSSPDKPCQLCLVPYLSTLSLREKQIPTVISKVLFINRRVSHQ